MGIKSFILENFLPSRSDSRTPSGKPRLQYIDLAKGICIILVVLLHSEVYVSANMLRPLRMPLFFMLSGIFFSNYNSLTVLLRKKFNRLIVPFLFFSLLSIPFAWMDSGRFNWEWLCLWDIYSNFNFVLWFLLSLFFDNIIFGAVTLFVPFRIAQALIVLSLSAIGWILALNDILLPFALTQSLLGLFFFFIGSLLRRSGLLRPNLKFDIPIAILGAAVFIFFMLRKDPNFYLLDFFYLKINGSPWGIVFLYSVVPVATLFVCKIIRWLPVISYCGRYSIIILGSHVLWTCVVWLFFEYIAIPRPQVVSFLIVLFLSWIFIPVARKLFPALCAQKDLF